MNDTELAIVKANDTMLEKLYSCTYNKKFLKEPQDQCSAVNHTEKVPGIYESENFCAEYTTKDTDKSQLDPLKSTLFDIPFGIRKTGRIIMYQ